MRLVCHATKTELEAYIERQTDTQIVFTIGGCNCMLAASLAAQHDPLYFHLETRLGEVRNVIVDTYHREEFHGCQARELRQTIEPQERRLLEGCTEVRQPSWNHTYSESLPDLRPKGKRNDQGSGRVSYRAEVWEPSWDDAWADALFDLRPERNIRCRFEVSYRGYGVWSRKEADLLRICHGNQAQFERLVAHAQRRNPGISREEAIEHAVYWYRRDNR